MLFSIALALIAGGAIGWLVQRSRSRSRYEQLQHKLAQQSRQLGHAQAEVTMLRDDFDEMKQRSQTELDALRHENRQLPIIAQNLEKSQLLVRQMMQRHEAQLRDISTENDVLNQRLRTATDREQTHRKKRTSVKAEYDGDRSSEQTADRTIDNTGANASAGKQDALPFDRIATDNSGTSLSDTDLRSNTGGNLSGAQKTPDPSPSASSWASTPLTSLTTTASIIDSAVKSVTGDVTSEDEDDPFDRVIEINDELHAEIVNDVDGQFENDLPLAEPGPDEEPLFEAVDQRDDLKQIFGIGPVTEKALNQLGITSYSQLADLKRHDIESIANALQIFPGRIERDNWVGNARRQLEEVLEEL
jgi:predicted flap endonuclease-1-like 5' DNA nuclease